MLSFRSEVYPDFLKEKIQYSDKIMFVGSCFAENIGGKLKDLKFKICLNPFGILYNPASIARSFDLILESKQFTKSDLFYFNEKWGSFLHHGRFSSSDYLQVLQNINHEIEIAGDYLKNAAHLFITFGTSWVYRLKKNSEIVANCHKLPAGEFEHFILSVQEIVEVYTALINKIRAFNQRINIIFTVSPIRHWKDGPVENQHSKSVLIVAIQELIKRFDFLSYFPSYEIMMDDLRDYRFYAEDMFHPNQTAIDYIWDKFRECNISSESIKLSQRVEKILKSMQHKVFYPQTVAYHKFIKNCIENINELTKENPELEFLSEMEYFKSELEKYSGKTG